jgi:ribosomal protein L5
MIHRIDGTIETEAESILSGLEYCQVVSVTHKAANDSFEWREGCDGHFTATLTRDQMLTLIEELKSLVGTKKKVKTHEL